MESAGGGDGLHDVAAADLNGKERDGSGGGADLIEVVAAAGEGGHQKEGEPEFKGAGLRHDRKVGVLGKGPECTDVRKRSVNQIVRALGEATPEWLLTRAGGKMFRYGRKKSECEGGTSAIHAIEAKLSGEELAIRWSC